MRCPHCAGQIPDRSRFCGICGRQIDEGSAAASVRGKAAPASTSLSPSLFELPVSPRARMVKLFAVLALDLVLVGAGVAMIISYMGARDRASGAPEPAPDAGVEAASVEFGTPVLATDVAPSPTDPTGSAETAGAGEAKPTSSARKRSPKRPPRTRPSTPTAPGAETPTPAEDSPGEADPPDPVDPGSDEEPDAPPGEAEPANPEEDAAARDARMKLLTHRVALVVNKNRGQFQRCYRRVAKASGPVQGKVVIRFKVKPDGRADAVRATTNETESELLAECLVAQFSSWSFPAHSEPEAIDFMWPIVFKAP